MGGQRFYWLKLNKDFFKSKRIKKLRKLAGGDTFTIIYLKMQLLATPTEGILTYTGLEETAAEEIALDIDEDPENVKITLQYLLKTGLCEMLSDNELFLPFVADNVGSEGSSAKRVRDFRERQKALQCNTPVTGVKQNVNGEIEIEIEKEKDINNSDSKEEKANSLFEELWKLYPRKEGKSSISKSKKLEIYKVGREKMIKVLELFNREMKNRDKQYIPYGSTFFNTSYKDYIDKLEEAKSKYEPPKEEIIDPEEEARQKAWEEGFHDA